MKFPHALIFLLLSACASHKPAPTASFGTCSDPVDLRLDPDGRRMRLLVDVTYTDPGGVRWLAPKDSVVDGASIPQPFWSVIGGPWEGRYRFASILHDVACDEKKRTWDQSAMMFYNAMRCSGVREFKAKVMYYAVYKFGPHWPPPGVMATMADVFRDPKHRALARQAPKRATRDDVRRVEAFVSKKNPSLKEIEADVLRSSTSP
jgi:hypothetical protein